ncbi:V4R domain-containing protein [Bacillus rubiinfantis]|uniref:V4R domain-containing protein n=1 Tax=Bacillus rubiinfantis TaxID=1499680 RepID=UPI0005A6A741|nr:V4R domain-containing protein [Bacillus rubiinfantis]
MDLFTYEDMKKINRKKLGDTVPLELFRSLRLIGMYQGLPLNGKNTTVTVGRKIGLSLPVQSIEDVLAFFKELRIGIPTVLESKDNEYLVKIDDCFCKGLPVHEGKKVCDLEGAILEGAISRFYDGKVMVREEKCNVSGDSHCEYRVMLL